MEEEERVAELVSRFVAAAETRPRFSEGLVLLVPGRLGASQGKQRLLTAYVVVLSHTVPQTLGLLIMLRGFHQNTPDKMRDYPNFKVP